MVEQFENYRRSVINTNNGNISAFFNIQNPIKTEMYKNMFLQKKEIKFIEYFQEKYPEMCEHNGMIKYIEDNYPLYAEIYHNQLIKVEEKLAAASDTYLMSDGIRCQLNRGMKYLSYREAPQMKRLLIQRCKSCSGEVQCVDIVVCDDDTGRNIIYTHEDVLNIDMVNDAYLIACKKGWEQDIKELREYWFYP